MSDTSHPHDHGHGASARKGRAFSTSVFLNVAFVAIEVIAGVAAGSIALIADAAHNLSDVLGLALAWGAEAVSARPPSARRTYGLRKMTIFAALANAGLLLVAVGGVLWEAVRRLWAPVPVQGAIVVGVALAGVLVNSASAALFARDRKDDINIEGAFLHLAADAAVSLGVVLSGVLILATGLDWIDPTVSLLVSLAILASTWSLLRKAINGALDAVPDHIDLQAVKAYLAGQPDVRHVHDLHIWAMSTSKVALTAHLVMPPAPHDQWLAVVCTELRDRFRIDHPTLQVEPLDSTCEQASEGSL